MLWLFISLGLLLIVIIWYVATYNRLIRAKALTGEAWAGIDTQLKRRHDLIPNLVETVKGYGQYEQKVLADLTALRGKAMSAGGFREKAAAENALTEGLRSVFALAEAYPDLKASGNYLDLQKNLASIEGDLQLARRYYNGSVRDINIAVRSFPSMIVAGMMGQKPVGYFEVESSDEREVPQVKF